MKNKGITLVALVITVIILIILAGISLTVLLGEEGLIAKAKQGANDYKTAAEEEKDYLESIEGLDLASNKAPTTVSGKAFGFEIATNGSGTEADPYIVTNKEQLAVLASLVNTGNSFEGKYIKLGNDIELDSTVAWTPIGNIDTTPFNGNFDGNGKTISGLYNAGLFNNIASNGVLKNLTIEGSIKKGAGVFCYNNYGLITGCCNKANFSDCGSAWGTAGITAYNYGIVEKCCNYGTITGYDSVGGIVGRNCGTITQCYNKGSISGSNNSIGGISGYSSTEGSFISNCYNNGNVSNGGGIQGNIWDGGKGYIYGCYTIQNTTIIKGVSGTKDERNTFTTNANTKLTELNDAIDVKDETSSTVNPWIADDTENPINGGYPILSWEVE